MSETREEEIVDLEAFEEDVEGDPEPTIVRGRE
jgi:hypothetical protein